MFASPLLRNANNTIIMITRNNLAKFFSSSSGGSGSGDLLTRTGGAANSAYFQYQHLHHKVSSSGGLNSTLTSTSISNCPPSGSTSTLTCCQPLHTSSGPLLNGTDRSSSQNNSTSGQNSEIKSKLDALKEKLSSNPYFEKYMDKFGKLELTSPRELLAKLEALDLDGKSSAKVVKGQKTKSQIQPQLRTKDHFLLNDLMVPSRIQDLSREDIILLWQKFHGKKDGMLAGVMSGSAFEKMKKLTATYPMARFVLPLPREDGYEFLFVQYVNDTFHFTPLIAYQTYKENAPEILRLIIYTDLQGSKDLVLIRGEFDKNLMTSKEAHIMALQVNFYYEETSDARTRLLESFSKKPDSFHHMDLIDELKKLQLSHGHLFEFIDD